MAVVYVPALPAGLVARAIAIDPGGNVLVAGATQSTGPGQDAFLARLTPDGQTLLSYQTFGGSASDGATVLAADAAGNVFVAGGTQSPDFPTTPGAYQTDLNGAYNAGFVIKVNPAGKIVYSTLFGASTGANIGISGMAIDSAGEVFLTGQAVAENFFTTPGSIQPKNAANTFFTCRLSAGGDRVIYSVAGVGGRAIAVDHAGNAIVQGVSFISDGSEVPVTAGAFQTEAKFSICAATRAFAFPCNHQYVAKLDPTGARLVFCTFLSGSYQDSPSGIAVDANGDIYVAGTTGSLDYPVTAGAAQSKNIVQLPPNAIDQQLFFGFAPVFPNTGYVTKLSGDGAHLLYSTFLGGSQADSLSGLALDSQGQVTVAAQVQSPDFPGLPAAPLRCLPDRLHDLPVVVTLDAKSGAFIATVLVEGVSPGGGPKGFAPDGRGGAYILTDGPYLANTRTGATDAIACLTDSFDYAAAGTISPGEMVTIFGSSLGPAAPGLYDPQSTVLPTTMGGTSVLVNGQAAPLVYVSQNQINFVVPYEVSGQSKATVQVMTSGSITGQRTIAVAPLTPSLNNGGTTEYPVCEGGTLSGAVQALVLNEDGTRNSCGNPAQAGSLIRVILNGSGVNTPGSTGLIPQTPVAITPFVSDVGHIVERTVAMPGAPLGGWAVDIRLNAVAYPYYTTVQLSVGGVPVREKIVAVWVAH